MKESCRCVTPGFCPRYQFTTTSREHYLCQTDERYRRMWDAGDSAQHKREEGLSKAIVRSDDQFKCVHRGAEVRRQTCKLCGAREQEAVVYSCIRHGECTVYSYGVRQSDAGSPLLPVCISCPDRIEDAPLPDARRVILTNGLSPGDVVVMTAAVKALHDAHPRQFVTDVRTPCPDLWQSNRFVTPLSEGETIRVNYDGVNQCNQRPTHFLQAMCDDLADALCIKRFSGNWLEPSIRLSEEEKGWLSQVHEITGDDKPFWIVNAGVKRDFTAKRWEGYQEVVTRTRHRIQWVQIGSAEHDHQPLTGVVDLLGKTDLRQFVRLVYHARGVLCGVTALMHLAHWVEQKGHRRAGVIIVGGREPPHWFAYPGHRVFSTIGRLDCCRDGGCWKSRIVRLEDGDAKDNDLCAYPVGRQGRCMAMIEPLTVAETILGMMP